MAVRRRSIRFKLFAILLVPFTALGAIWAFTATLIAEEGFKLLQIDAVYNHVVVPTRGVIVQLQRERSLSVQALGSAYSLQTDLERQRRLTDEAARTLARESAQAADETPPAMRQRIQALIAQVERLDDLRTRVDERRLSRLDAIDEYSAVLETAFQAYDHLMISQDLELIGQTKAIILIARSHEVAAQEAALLSGVVASGRYTVEDRDAFASMVSRRRLLYQLGTGQLDAELIKRYTAFNDSPVHKTFLAVEEQLTRRGEVGRTLPVGALNWPAAAEQLVHRLTELNAATSRDIADRAAPLARGVLLRIGVAGALGAGTAIAAVFISLRFARKLSGELTGLERAVVELAERRLPSVLARLRRGEDVDVAAETRPLGTDHGTTEVASLSRAFGSVQRTAIEAAVEQAKLRKGVNKVFLNLARRNQSLLTRQFALLDTLEKEITDPDLLEKVFGIDHLAARMRRHAEGLIILSGAAPARGWRNPVNLHDVVRAATEQVEDYQRVDVQVPHTHALVGRAATDVIHLLAELIENATAFSPPQSKVLVRGEAVARGYSLEIEDRGLGMTPEDMERFNQRLADPPEIDLADSDRLGLFVVGLLAKRHGIKVALRASPYGGTSAIVLLPQELVVEHAAEDLELTPLQPQEPSAPALAIARPDGAPKSTLPRRIRQANLAPQLRQPRGDLYSAMRPGSDPRGEGS
ncbi:hypothetical protein TBS_21170 [Thermobispora bispora]|uniref:sensor histidine kinase n=1 Tax=Thermobispora bispora TaxID=2006 RepID=UPI001980F8A4|nr:nitrate- and nitrite sensing domain-containing protein [Thermobispora bispora]MBO2474417.1 sensor [Actinomycetales bacterium]MBX6166029.1 sensor histidine kinase [Thermobispora bispora]QSI47010.1 sensor histidine kinase [Thermobispora bispora]